MNGFLDDLPDLGLPEIPVKRRKQRPKETPEAVIYVRLLCPKCKSPRVPVQNTQPETDGYIIRYHKCEDCGKTFKSVEKV